VQVHLERDGEGVRVWLGIPASEQAALRAPALVGALRRSLASEGYRLSTVVCNGAPYPDAPQPVSRAIRHIQEQP
jgi:hypothetical protein